MQLKVFSVAAIGGDAQIEEVNAFLRSHKIVSVDRQLVQQEGSTWWTFCVTWLPGVSPQPQPANQQRKTVKVDYRETLDPEIFAVFTRLRVIRRALAEADAVPAYAVFTDAELAQIASLPQIDEKGILSIEGIGAKRVEKYGRVLCQKYVEANETGGASD